MNKQTKYLIDDTLACLRAEMQPFTLRGRDKQYLYRAFKRAFKPIAIAHDSHWINQIPRKRTYSPRGRRAMLRNLELANRRTAQLAQ